MSMITSCPACGTMFRVVPDQLKISEGWVRCGHCAEVFDATAHLSDESVLAEPPTAQPARRSEQPVDTQEPTAPAERAARTPEPAKRARATPVREHDELSSSRSSESSSFFGAESQVLEPSPLDTPFVFRPSDLVRSAGDSSLLPDPEPERAYQVPLAEDEDEGPPPELEHVSFVRQARRRAFWRRPGVRIALAFTGVLLAALLVLQLAHQDRDRLALAQPRLRPALDRMCQLLDCRLGPPRQIEAIVIESSGFNRLRSDTYRLAFTLRNNARIQVAAPAMELTITDTQDQPIARRVIVPQEFASAGEVIAPGAEWSRSVGLVLTEAGADRVAGYRLLAFYP